MNAPAAVALAMFLSVGAFAARPITPAAPEFPENVAWINSKPFSLKQLYKRRVVLTAFLDADNLNSLRALEALKTWQGRYEQNGLLVVAVHTPDLPFQRDPRRVKEQFKKLGVDFPVVVDDDKSLWKAYGNEGWPAFYLIDIKGRIVFDRLGEGGYAELEGEIRAELAKAGFEPAPLQKKLADRRMEDCGDFTPDASAGMRRGSPVNLEKESRKRADTFYLLPAHQGEVGYSGSWDAEPDALRLAQTNARQSAYIQVLYRGAQAFSLLGPPLGGSRYYVRQDNLWLHSGNAGDDVRFDDDGRSFIEASQPRLYHLAKNQNDAMHALALIPIKEGAAVYGFSFTDRCLTLKLPR